MSETPKKFKKYLKSQMSTLASQLATIDGLIDVIVVSDVQSNMVDVLEIVDCKKNNHAAAETLFEMYADQLNSGGGGGGGGGGTRSSRKRNAKQDDASKKMAPRKKKKMTQKIVQVLDDSDEDEDD
jgi:hypothetical protein